MNFDNVLISRELGYGMLGTVYLVEYKSNTYAMKVQKILKKDYDNPDSNFRTEIEFYKYIDRLPPNNQIFFTIIKDTFRK